MKENHAGLPVSFTIPDPEKEIQDAINNGNWISAFATAVSFFEHYGIRVIKDHYATCGINEDKKKIENMGAYETIKILCLLEVIDKQTFKKMKKINTERNNLIHPKRKGIKYRYQIREKWIELLQDAKKCINQIKKGLK